MGKKRYRSHRKKRRKKYNTSPLPLLVAIPLAYVFYLSKDFFVDKNPVIYVASFFVAVTVISLLIALTVFFWKRHRALKRKKALEIADIDRMSGISFEHYVGALLKNQGYQQVTVTPSGNDFGTDILCKKNGTTFAVQVKRNRGLVGVAALYQALGGKEYHQQDRAVVISNSFYSPAAEQLAKKTNLWLVDREQLTTWIVQFQNS